MAFFPGVMFTLALFADFCDEPSSLGINHPIRFDQTYEGEQSVGLAMFFFLIGKAGEPPEMPPVRRFSVAVESVGQSTGNRCSDSVWQTLTVVEPGLKIPARRFDDRGRLEAFRFHSFNSRF